jgi:hypothetical protein
MRFRYLRALLAVVLVGGVALPLLHFVALTVHPPRTPDGHPVMPIGQVGFAILFAPVLGAIAGYFAGRSRRPNEDTPPRRSRGSSPYR